MCPRQSALVPLLQDKCQGFASKKLAMLTVKSIHELGCVGGLAGSGKGNSPGFQVCIGNPRAAQGV